MDKKYIRVLSLMFLFLGILIGIFVSPRRGKSIITVGSNNEQINDNSRTNESSDNTPTQCQCQCQQDESITVEA